MFMKLRQENFDYFHFCYRHPVNLRYHQFQCAFIPFFYQSSSPVFCIICWVVVKVDHIAPVWFFHYECTCKHLHWEFCLLKYWPYRRNLDFFYEDSASIFPYFFSSICLPSFFNFLKSLIAKAKIAEKLKGFVSNHYK